MIVLRRYMFLEEVEIVPGIFNQLPLISVNRIPTVQSHLPAGYR